MSDRRARDCDEPGRPQFSLRGLLRGRRGQASNTNFLPSQFTDHFLRQFCDAVLSLADLAPNRADAPKLVATWSRS